MPNPTLYDPVTFNDVNDLNLIIDTRVKYDREYVLIDRLKIHDAIEDPDRLLEIFNNTELEILFKQALEMNYLSETDYLILLDNYNEVYNIIAMDDIHNLLMKQYTYITKIPSMRDLEANGLLDSIIHTIQDNPTLLIDQPLVFQYSNDFLTEKLKHDHFISFNDTELILEKQFDFLKILDFVAALDLLNRVKPYLSFITDDKLAAVQLKSENNDFEILDIFTPIEIKFIIDKEIELKYLLLKTLNPENIKSLFDELRISWINSDLPRLVEEHFNILKQELFGVDYDDLIRDQVDAYLARIYNTLIQSTIDNAFQLFKDNFINIELRDIIQNYFNEMKEELFGNNYDELIREQVENYLTNNFPRISDPDVQLWIQESL